jgi:hypothetical protein
LQGWEPREFHEYVYEDDRLVGAIVTREATFRPQDVDMLLAHLENVADKGPHGIPMSEATDPANQFAFEGQGPFVDYAAKAQKDKQDAYYREHDSKNNPVNRNGHIFTVRRRA